MMPLLASSRTRFGMLLLAAGFWFVIGVRLQAQERRARPPKFDQEDFRGVFYDDIGKVIGANRPRVDQLRNDLPGPAAPRNATGQSAATMPDPSAANGNSSGNAGGNGNTSGKWSALTSAGNLEDEFKNVKLEFDSLITTPGRFKSGDYRKARSKMFVMSTLLAVISEFDGDIRFKSDAPVLRDLVARSAINLTGDSFAEAKQRMADLQDVISGGGLSRSAPSGETDWSIVATRSSMMEYLELLLEETLRSGAKDSAAFAANKGGIDRAAAMVAIVGKVLNQEGMDEADDADYQQLSDAMKQAALDLRLAVVNDDAEAARLAVGAIGQSCSACHEQYR